METQNETTEINSFASGGINRARHVNGLERRGAERQHDGQQNERPNAAGHDEETWHDEATQNDAKASAPDDEEAPDDEKTGHDVDTRHDKKVRLKFLDNPYAQKFGAYFPMSKRRRASVADAWLALYGDYLYKYVLRSPAPASCLIRIKKQEEPYTMQPLASKSLGVCYVTSVFEASGCGKR